MLQIPDQIASELGLHVGVPVEVTRTVQGFEVKVSEAGLRRSADGVWRSHADRIAILDRLKGKGQALAGPGNQVEALLADRAADAILDQCDGVD